MAISIDNLHNVTSKHYNNVTSEHAYQVFVNMFWRMKESKKYKYENATCWSWSIVSYFNRKRVWNVLSMLQGIKQYVTWSFHQHSIHLVIIGCNQVSILCSMFLRYFFSHVQVDRMFVFLRIVSRFILLFSKYHFLSILLMTTMVLIKKF